MRTVSSLASIRQIRVYSTHLSPTASAMSSLATTKTTFGKYLRALQKAKPITTTFRHLLDLIPQQGGWRHRISKMFSIESLPPPTLSESTFKAQKVLREKLGCNLSEDMTKAVIQVEHNRSAAFIGDAVLALAIRRKGYYENLNPGHLTKCSVAQHSNASLARTCKTFQLHSILHPSPGVSTTSVNAHATLVEAVIGAIYLTEGLESAVDAMHKLRLLETDQSTAQSVIKPKLKKTPKVGPSFDKKSPSSPFPQPISYLHRLVQ